MSCRGVAENTPLEAGGDSAKGDSTLYDRGNRMWEAGDTGLHLSLCGE